MKYFFVKYNPLQPNGVWNSIAFGVRSTKGIPPIKILEHYLKTVVDFPVLVKKDGEVCEYFKVDEIPVSGWLSLFAVPLGTMMDDVNCILIDRLILSTEKIENHYLICDYDMVMLYDAKIIDNEQSDQQQV